MGLLSTEASPISLADVLLAREAGEKSHSLYEDLCAAAENTELAWSEPTRHAARKLLEKLEAWRTLAVSLPIDRLLRQLYSEPFLSPMANTPALLCLYDYARNYQNTAFCGLYQFLQYFKQVLRDKKALAAAGLQQNDDTVKIMTIHNSKGLEFPAVFLCNCAKAFNTDDTRAPLMFDAAMGVATRQYNADDGSVSETVTRHAVAHRIRQRQTEEEMRLLYVALTRARERLTVTAALTSQAAARIHAANRPTKGNRHVILSAKCYLDWILAALAPANGVANPDFVRLTVKDRQDYSSLDGVKAEAPDRVAAKPPSVSDDAAFYRDILEAHKSFVDVNAAVRYLPTKAAASKLRTAMLDRFCLPEEFGGGTEGQKDRSDDPALLLNTREFVNQRIELMQSAPTTFEALMKSEQSATAAQKGTATHLFFQHCDFSRLARTSPAQEVERLTADGFLPARLAALLRTDHLDAFVHSDLFALLTEDGVKTWREQNFDRFLPYDRLTRNPALAERVKGYTLYVQGSLDLVIEQKDGTLWLCDYKTDRIVAPDEAGVRTQLLSAHADQLRVYIEAVAGLFGRLPDHVTVYSVPLGRLIDLSDDLLANNERR